VTSRTQVPKRRLSAADRREAILAAALEVFSERGFHEGSLDDVATRNGVSKALIYEHFASKRELHQALLEMYVHQLLERVTTAIALAADEEARLRDAVDALLGFVEENRDAWRLLVRHVTDPGLAAALDRVREEVAAAIGALMAEDIRDVMPDDPLNEEAIDVVAHQVVGAVQSLANWWVDHPDVPRERMLAHAMDFAWLGLHRLGEGERWTS
jgi:AcrR family transcriptional regulator